MSVMSQCYSVIIDRGIIAPGHGKEVADGINAIEKRYIYQLMSNVKLPVSKTSDSQIIIHYYTKTLMPVWPKNSKKICLRIIGNMESLIRENTEKYPVK